MSTAVDDFTADSNGPAESMAETPDLATVAGDTPAVPASPSPEADASERASSEAPAEAGDTPPPSESDRARDEQGRFAKTEDQPPAQPAKKKSYQARIDEAVLLQRKAERDRDYWRQQAERTATPAPAAGSAGSPPAPQADAEPTYEAWVAAHPDHPEPYLGFLGALTDWRVGQRLAQERQQAQQSQRQQSTQARVAKFHQDLEGLRATTPDFDSAMAVLQNTPATEELSQAILEADAPALLALHLARHADEFDHVRSLTGPSLYRALGRLESRLGAAPSGPTPTTSVIRANPPIKPVGSSPVVSDSPPTDANSDDQHFEYWNRKEREARQRR